MNYKFLITNNESRFLKWETPYIFSLSHVVGNRLLYIAALSQAAGNRLLYIAALSQAAGNRLLYIAALSIDNRQ
jgi:hypothetical protein